MDITVGLAFGILMLYMVIKFSNKRHEKDFDKAFLLVYTSKKKQLEDVLIEGMEHVEAKRIKANHEDYAQRYLDPIFKQVMMSLV